jgi:hypothetical protein
MPGPRRPSYTAKLEAMLAAFEADNAALRQHITEKDQRIAELEHPPHFVPLKRVEARGYSTETVRRWCHGKLVKHRWDGQRLLVDQNDLTERCNRLTGQNT